MFVARHSNITGAPLTTGRVAVSISHAAPIEVVLEEPVDIPTTIPESAQISHVIPADSMPVWNPYPLPHRVAAICYVAGSNTGSSDAMMYYLLKHGAECVASGSINCPAGKHFTISAAVFPDVVAGDKITCTLWADASGIVYDYTAITLYTTAICAGSYPVQHAKVTCFNPINLTKGNPTLAHASLPMMPAAGGQPDSFTYYAPDSIVPLVSTHPVYGLACVEYGDTYRGCVVTFHDTAKPYYYANHPINRIEYTGTVLRV